MKQRYYYCVIFIGIIIFYTVYAKVSSGMPNGQIYNMEAQNIVNTTDLIIKAERAYFENSGTFTDINGLEYNSAAYLSPMKIYNFQGDSCIRKVLLKSIANICINLQKEMLEIYIPLNLSNEDIVTKEISIGVTGKAGQVSDINGFGVLYFNLNDNLSSSFTSSNSNSGTVSSAGSISASPDANGGIDYTNTSETTANILNKAIQAITGFLTFIISLF